MGYRLPTYLHRNRHGTLYLRLAVPADLRHVIGQGELYRSLSTASIRDAADASQMLPELKGVDLERYRGKGSVLRPSSSGRMDFGELPSL